MKTYDDYFPMIVVNEFADSNVEKFRTAVLQESFVDQEAPIVIYIDSDGGQVDAMASMIEILQAVPNPIHTVCVGRACSAGAILLSFGVKRYCGPHSVVMIHEFSAGAIGHLRDMVNHVSEIKRSNHYWMSMVAKNCGLKSTKELKDKLNGSKGRDLWLNANQAKDLGIVHEVGVPLPVLKERKPKRSYKRKK